MALKVARRGRIDPFIVMEVMRAAAEQAVTGADVVHLEVGQPSTPAPRKVLAAAKVALDKELIGYTLALGIPELRARIAQHYREFYCADVPAERIVVTTGSSGGFLLAFLTAFEPGDRVALAAPGYPAYRNILTALGIEAVEIPAGPDTRYQPTPELLEKHGGRLDGLIIASPANPTGTMLSPEALADLTAYCESKSIRLVSDEIYHGITYGMGTATALQTSGSAIIVNSFSKYYSMTGWRLGYLAAPLEIAKAADMVQSQFTSATCSITQRCAITALRGELDTAREMVAAFRERRAFIYQALKNIPGLQVNEPDGAFYMFPNVSAFFGRSYEDSHIANADDLCMYLLHKANVSVVTGAAFQQPECIRISYATGMPRIEEGMKRMKEWLGKLK